jgi:hypothetical protein
MRFAPLLWLLYPASLLPLFLHSSAPRLWCGYGLGRPWHYGYLCEERGLDIDSIAAFFGDFFVGLAAVVVFQILLDTFWERESYDT